MKTIRELINLIETAQNPEQQYKIYFVIPEHDDYDDRHEPTETTIVTAGSANEAGKKFRAEVPEAYIEQIVPLNYNKGVAEGTDDDVEHLANVAADAYWSGKFGMTSATEKVKMARDIVQAVEDGRLSIEELRQDIKDLDKPGVAEGTNGWVVYNIRGRIIKNFADEAEARQYAKQYGFYVKPQGVAEALSKTDLVKQVSETYTPTAGELAQDHIKMADGDFNKKYGMSKQQANHYYSSSKLKEPSPREKEAAKWGRKSSVYPFSR